GSVRDRLALDEHARHLRAVGERQAHDVGGQEKAEPVGGDETQEAEHQDQREGQCAAGQPDEGLPAPPELPRSGAHRYRYRCRSLSRTSSATVFTTNVRQKSRNAARKRTRNSVPPSGASGSSTAMFADSARKPLKIDQSMTGVLPVAMSTIMVSPTARPKPIMIAEKMPGLAVGSTMRSAVCQRVAPSASDPARRWCGTLASESSAMVKMIGMTANPMATPTTSELRWS